MAKSITKRSASNSAANFLADPNEARLGQAAAFGIDRLVNPSREDLGRVVRDLTGGLGADVAIVAAPAAKPQEQAIDLVRKRGTVCLFASLPKGKSELTLDSRTIHYGELRVVGCSDSTPAHVARAVAMLAGGTLPAGRLITHILPLDGVLGAFDLMARGEACVFVIW